MCQKNRSAGVVSNVSEKTRVKLKNASEAPDNTSKYNRPGHLFVEYSLKRVCTWEVVQYTFYKAVEHNNSYKGPYWIWSIKYHRELCLEEEAPTSHMGIEK